MKQHQPYRVAYRKEKVQEAQEPELLGVPMGEPKPQRPVKDAVIRVLVKLPAVDIRLEFLSRNVLGNVPKDRLTKENFERSLKEGLEKLLGGVETV